VAGSLARQVGLLTLDGKFTAALDCPVLTFPRLELPPPDRFDMVEARDCAFVGVVAL
jgi:hypothetical protein